MSNHPCCRSVSGPPPSLQPSRRSFFASMLAAALALIAWPRTARAARKVALPLAKAEKLQTVGGFMVAKIKDQDLLLVRDGEKSVHAFDALCTHERCALTYDSGSKRVKCPCHNGLFDLSGKVLSGPVRKALPAYEAVLEADKIVLTLP
jgi:Rieske Fe-S protein